MAERCRHGFVTVSETSGHAVCTEVAGGVVEVAWEDGPYPTGKGSVKCNNCGRIVRYGMRRANLPKWAYVAVRAVECAATDTGEG